MGIGAVGSDINLSLATAPSDKGLQLSNKPLSDGWP